MKRLLTCNLNPYIYTNPGNSKKYISRLSEFHGIKRCFYFASGLREHFLACSAFIYRMNRKEAKSSLIFYTCMAPQERSTILSLSSMHKGFCQGFFQSVLSHSTMLIYLDKFSRGDLKMLHSPKETPYFPGKMVHHVKLTVLRNELRVV